MAAASKQGNDNDMPDEDNDMRRFKRRALPLHADFLLPDGSEAEGTVDNISAGGALIRCDCALALGDELTVRIERIGQFKAIVRRLQEDSIAIEFAYRRDRAARLADKLICLINDDTESENRRAESREPVRYASSLTLPDGRTVPCEVIDRSELGAAVAISPAPRVGTKVHLGERAGVVVRTEDGIAGLRFYPESGDRPT